MSAPHDRRGFLRGLASLPLIGGGLTLIGRPTAAAVPATDALQERYLTWLAHEHRAAVREHRYRQALRTALRHPWSSGRHDASPQAYAARVEREGLDYLLWFPDAPDIEATVASAPTSSRAAVVLSAVGCDWREVRS